MKIDVEPNGSRTLGANSYVITLSRRNLRALLAMLDDPEHQSKTIGQMTDVGWLYIKAEEDAEHYAGRQPGRMGARIEQRLAQAASCPRCGVGSNAHDDETCARDCRSELERIRNGVYDR